MDRLLVIEDSASIRILIAAYLEKEGFQVIQAASGEEALDLIASNHPQVILCDLGLPDLSGTELMRRVRQENTLPFMPAIMISVRQRTEEIVRALQFAEDYLIKPINLVELRARVLTMLRLKHSHEEINRLNFRLEERVGERTRELDQANAALKKEIILRSESEAEVQRLSRRVIELREEERADLAREIHDTLGTSLLTLKLQFQTAWKELDPKGAQAERLHEILNLINSTTESARGLSRNLSPLAIEGIGLCETISGLMETFRRTNPAIAMELELPDEEPDLKGPVRIHVYRIVQEALINAVRHSGATTIRVSLEARPGFRVSVRDDGVGFNRSRSVTGIGLSIMRQRAQAIAGSFEVETGPGRGTRVVLALDNGKQEVS